MNWLIWAGAGVGVLAVIGAVLALRLRAKAPMMRSPEEAMHAAQEAMPGFAAADAVVGEDGRAALVQSPDGTIVLVKAHGARAIARPVAWGEIRQDYDGLLVETGERRFGTVLLVGITVLDVRRLAPASVTDVLLHRP